MDLRQLRYFQAVAEELSYSRAAERLRIGYIGPPTQPFLGRLLQEYRRRYPLVSLHLEERTPERVWEMLAKGRLSAAFTRPVFAAAPSGLRTVTLCNEK